MKPLPFPALSAVATNGRCGVGFRDELICTQEKGPPDRSDGPNL